ncbi:hypothetical protein CBS101457_006633 [Exobasidium rhododendri]|nr:hypothetical protein CBS101457_006633 [Exobasidium rhododendri]
MKETTSPLVVNEADNVIQQPRAVSLPVVKTPEIRHIARGADEEQQETNFDLDGWPEGVKRPTHFCGVNWSKLTIFPISPVFCCMNA